MRLTLSQQELEAAVRSYVTGMINLSPGTDVSIDFTAGRGANGTTADVDISYLDVKSAPEIQNTVNTKGVSLDKSSLTDLPKTSGEASEEQAKTAAKEPRKTTGKNLFGSTDKAADKVTVDTDAPSANDDDQPAGDGAGERKSLFNS